MFSRRFRHFLARLGIASLLFMQMALSVYACPMQMSAATAQQTTAFGVDKTLDAMPGGCADSHAEQPQLCWQHCHVVDQSHDNLAADTGVPPMQITTATLILPVEPRNTLGIMPQPVLLARQTAPPPAIRYCVFRL
jgi:hypothetical protein